MGDLKSLKVQDFVNVRALARYKHPKNSETSFLKALIRWISKYDGKRVSNYG